MAAMRLPHMASVLGGLVLVVSACGSSHEHLPTAVCGSRLSTSPAGPIFYDIAHGPVPPILSVSTGSAVYVIVSDNCHHGAHVDISPASAYVITKEVDAADRAPAAVVLVPTQYVPAVLVATRDGHIVGSVLLDIIPEGFRRCGVTEVSCPFSTGPSSYDVVVSFGAQATSSDIDAAKRCGHLPSAEGLLLDQGALPHGIVQIQAGAAEADAIRVRDCLSRTRGVESASVITYPTPGTASSAPPAPASTSP